MGFRGRGDCQRMVRELLVSYQHGPSEEVSSQVGDDSAVGSLLVQAHLSKRWLYQRVGCVLIGALIGAALAGWIVPLIILVSGVVFLYVHICSKASAHRRSIERDLPALLTSVASSVRAGIDPLSALVGAREYLPRHTVLVKELEKIHQGLTEGRDEEQLLEGFLSEYGSQDGELFKRCLILSRRHGGSLAEPLHRITRVVRQRQSFKRKTKAALAMHRMSAIGIALCAAAMGALQFAMNPRALEVAMQHPAGSKLLMGGTLLIVTGVSWMMTMGSEADLQ